MSAEPLRAQAPQAEQPPAPAQAAPQENLLKKDFGEGGLRGAEQAAERAGMEKLNELGKNLNLQAEAGAQEFGQQTKSWWQRTKDKFRKKEDATPIKGEAEILLEIEKADAVFAEFRKKAAEIMASGDEAGLRMLERSLSKSYDELAPQVAAEGAADASAMKRALKTGEMPPVTETGAKLNYVAKRLQEVRGRLSAKPTAEAPRGAAAASSEAQPDNVIDLQAEREKRAQEAIRESADGYAKTFDPKLRAELTDAPIQLEGQASAQDMRVLKFSHADFPEVTWMMPIAGRTPADIEDQLQIAIPKVYAQKMRRVTERQAAEKATAVPAASPEAGTDENPILLTPEMRLPSTEGVVSGEIEAKLDEPVEDLLPNVMVEPQEAPPKALPPAAEAAPEPPTPMTVKTTEQAPPSKAETQRVQRLAEAEEGVLRYQKEIDGLKEEAARTNDEGKKRVLEYELKLAEQKRAIMSRQTQWNAGDMATRVDAVMSALADAEHPTTEPAPAESAPETQSEKKEFPMDRLSAATAVVAEKKVLPLAKAFESPKTYGTKVIMKLSAAEFLKLYTDEGRLSAEDAAALADEFKTDSEGFNNARKKLAEAVNKLTR